MQAARILANLIVMGGSIVGRAFVQAYRQALQSKVFIFLSWDVFAISETNLEASLLFNSVISFIEYLVESTWLNYKISVILKSISSC